MYACTKITRKQTKTWGWLQRFWFFCCTLCYFTFGSTRMFFDEKLAFQPKTKTTHGKDCFSTETKTTHGKRCLINKKPQKRHMEKKPKKTQGQILLFSQKPWENMAVQPKKQKKNMEKDCTGPSNPKNIVKPKKLFEPAPYSCCFSSFFVWFFVLLIRIRDPIELLKFFLCLR